MADTQTGTQGVQAGNTGNSGTSDSSQPATHGDGTEALRSVLQEFTSEMRSLVQGSQSNTQQSSQNSQSPDSQSPARQNSPTTGQVIMETLEALPERIVKALDERSPKPTPTRSQQKVDSSSDAPPAKTPGKKSFAEWWVS